jgi:hypothetical protein
LIAFIALNIMPRKKKLGATPNLSRREEERGKKSISHAGNDFGSCFNQ